MTTVRYNQIPNNPGTLTLFNGLTTVGTLVFAGTYTGSQFQIQSSGGGSSTSITYAASPSTASGTQISAGNDAYSWTNTNGGIWTATGNWTDTTTGKAATAAPGVGDAVVVQDTLLNAKTQIISGSGSAASLAVSTFLTSTVFTGTITVAGGFSVSNGTGVTLSNGAAFSMGNLNAYGQLLITGASATVTGVGGGTEVVGGLTVANGATFAARGLFDLTGGTVGVDSTSIMEVGSAGGAATGAMTIDTGQTASAESNAKIAANLIVNGVMIINAGTISGFGGSIGTITGSGTVEIGRGIGSAKLTLQSADSALLQFYNGFNASPGTLEVQGPLPTGMISGFTVGDSIQMDQTVTNVSFSQTSGTQGTLTLKNGSATVGSLALLGDFTGNAFRLDVAPATGFGTISLVPKSSVTSSGAATGTFDAYRWNGASGGSWSVAANWFDTTTGTIPLTVPGGYTNPVTITGTTAINGNGLAGDLWILGDVLLTGMVTVTWTLTVEPNSGQSDRLMQASNSIIAADFGAVTGTWEVGGASIGLARYWLNLMSGSLLAVGGSLMQTSVLLTSGTGNIIAVDAASVIKIGWTGNAPLGALYLAAETSTMLTGSVYGNVVVNGDLWAPTDGSLFIDMTGNTKSDPYSSTPTISGTGTLRLTKGSTLAIGAADAAAIRFAGPNATLVLATLPTGTISGFAAGDVIQVDQTVTGLSFQQTSGVLTLTNGAATVGTLNLTGNYSGTAFHLDASPGNSAATITLQTLGIAASQPTPIFTATGNGQTISGDGGSDTLRAGGFSGVKFQDLTAFMNNYTVPDFTASDSLGFHRPSPGLRMGGVPWHHIDRL